MFTAEENCSTNTMINGLETVLMILHQHFLNRYILVNGKAFLVACRTKFFNDQEKYASFQFISYVRDCDFEKAAMCGCFGASDAMIIID